MMPAAGKSEEMIAHSAAAAKEKTEKSGCLFERHFNFTYTNNERNAHRVARIGALVRPELRAGEVGGDSSLITAGSRSRARSGSLDC